MLFFQEHALIAQKDKIPHIFHITNQNELNQSFPYNYGLFYEMKI
jgi:hypothetical protein